MEVHPNKPIPYIDLSTDNFLNEFTQGIPNTNEPAKEQPQQNITASDDNDNGNNLQTETKQVDDNNSLQRNGNRLRCPECHRYTARDEDQLIRHIRKVHRGENPFQCFMCDYGTYNKCLFEEHVRIHKGIKPFKCSHCPHRSVSKKNLKRHELIHRPGNPLKCPHCDHIANHHAAYNSHAKKYHPLKPTDRVPGPDRDPTCNWCQKNFPDQNSLVMHTARMKTCNALLDGGSNRCDYTACSSYKMKSHRVTEHGEPATKPTKRKWWKCQLCEWSSNTKSMVLLHLIHHPKQTVDESQIDLTILRKHGIVP